VSTLRFSDGMEFNTSGPLRITRRSDGLYVVGNGMLCAVDSPEEGRELIQRERERTNTKLRRDGAKED